MPHWLSACRHGNLDPWIIQVLAGLFSGAVSLIPGRVGWCPYVVSPSYSLTPGLVLRVLMMAIAIH